jgi:hypothetical protein
LEIRPVVEGTKLVLLANQLHRLAVRDRPGKRFDSLRPAALRPRSDGEEQRILDELRSLGYIE